MVYKRYVRKNGKVHGPYYYESYREDGVVKKKYIGSELPVEVEKQVVPRFTTAFFLQILIVLLVIVALTVLGFLAYLPLAKVTLDIQTIYTINEPLTGSLTIAIQPGDSIQKDTQIRLTLSEGGTTLAEGTNTFEEFLGNQISYVEITSETVSCVNITIQTIQEVCQNETTEETVEEVCHDETSEGTTEEICEDVTDEVCHDEVVDNETVPVCEEITESVCHNETIPGEITTICLNETIPGTTQEVCMNETVYGGEEENCTAAGTTDYYYNTTGEYSKEIQEFFDYDLDETGDYVLTLAIPALDISESAEFSVEVEEEPVVPEENITEPILPEENLTELIVNKTEMNFTIESGVYPDTYFVAPTPANRASVNGSSVVINTSIVNVGNLGEIGFNWNGTNYTMYNNSLMLMLNFDNRSVLGENATVIKDFSRYGNNGSCSGATCPIWTADGKFDGAFYYGGTNTAGDYLTIPDRDDWYFGTEPFVIELWVYWNESTPTDSGFWTQATDKDNYLSFGYNDNSYGGSPCKNIGFWSTSGSGVGPICWEPQPYNWYHLALVRGYGGDANNYTILINGEVNGSAISSGALPNRGESADIGRVRSGEGTNDYWLYHQGYIDNFRIYKNMSMTLNEVRQHYYSNLYRVDASSWQLYVNQQNLAGGI